MWHDDVVTWKHFQHYLPFVKGIHWSSVDSPHKRPVQQSFDVLLLALTSCWTNKQFTSDLKWYDAHVTSLWWCILTFIFRGEMTKACRSEPSHLLFSLCETKQDKESKRIHGIDGLVQDCCISRALALEIPQYFTKPLILVLPIDIENPYRLSNCLYDNIDIYRVLGN